VKPFEILSLGYAQITRKHSQDQPSTRKNTRIVIFLVEQCRGYATSFPGSRGRRRGDEFGDEGMAVSLDMANKQQKQQNAPHIYTLMRTSGKSVLSVCIV